MITTCLALAAAVAVALAAVAVQTPGAHTIATYAAIGLWVIALWVDRRARARARARAYHRTRCHARPTLRRRARLFFRRLRKLRLRTAVPARTA